MTARASIFNHYCISGLFLAALLSYFAWTFNHDLWNPDETREAGIVWEMVASGNLTVPHLNGKPFLEKPPLYYWTAFALAKLAGRLSPGLVRLPAVLYGLLGVIVTALLGRRLFGLRAGLLAGIVLAVLPEYYTTAHFALTDLPLAAFVCLAFSGFLELSRATARASRLAFLFLFCIAAALSFLAKGLVGPAVIGVPLFLYLPWERRSREILLLGLWGGAVLALAAGPWLYAVWQQGGAELLRVLLIENQFGRFAHAALGHQHWFGYYLYIFPFVFLPWTLLLLPAAVSGGARLRRENPDRSAWRFLFCWLLGDLLSLSLSSGKREIYLLPLFAPAALMIGRWLEEVLEKSPAPGWQRGCLSALALIARPAPLLLALAGMVLFPYRLWPHLITLALAAAAIVGGRTIGKRRDYGAMPLFAALVSVYLIVASSRLLAGFLNHERSFKPFLEMVRAQVPAGANLCGLHLSEMQEGAAVFYLQRTFPNPQSVAELERLRQGRPSPPLYVLVVDKDVARYHEYLRRLRLVASYEQGDRGQHRYFLFAGEG